jgi:hypothetical protein
VENYKETQAMGYYDKCSDRSKPEVFGITDILDWNSLFGRLFYAF